MKLGTNLDFCCKHFKVMSFLISLQFKVSKITITCIRIVLCNQYTDSDLTYSPSYNVPYFKDLIRTIPQILSYYIPLLSNQDRYVHINIEKCTTRNRHKRASYYFNVWCTAYILYSSTPPLQNIQNYSLNHSICFLLAIRYNIEVTRNYNKY